jgi:hypothetical protein
MKKQQKEVKLAKSLSILEKAKQAKKDGKNYW